MARSKVARTEMARLQRLSENRTQLGRLLDQLNKLARDVEEGDGSKYAEEKLLEALELEEKNSELEESARRVRKDHEAELKILKVKIDSLEDENRMINADMTAMVIENNRLSTLALKRDEDNETISNVLEQISCDYQDLQKAFDSQKCPKDDKILALRKTAKALEAENQLLNEERMIKARDNANIHNNLLKKLTKVEDTCKLHETRIAELESENKVLSERYNRLEEEKINVLREMTKVERALEACEDKVALLKQDNADILEAKLNTEERLAALKDSKRVVELKYQNVLMDKSGFESKICALNQSNELMQVKNQSLEERLMVLEREKVEQTDICAQIQQNLIQKTSEYESQFRSMQQELDSRIDELDVTKKDDVEKVKNHYFELFHEKASEISTVRSELEAREEALEAYKAKCKDLEYREQELSDLVDKIRSNPSSFDLDDTDIKIKLEEYAEKNTQLQARIDVIKGNFYEMKSRENEIISVFATRSQEMSAVLADKDAQVIKLNIDLDIFRAQTRISNTLPKSSQCEFNLKETQEPKEESDNLVNGGQLQNKKKKRNRKKSKV